MFPSGVKVDRPPGPRTVEDPHHVNIVFCCHHMSWPVSEGSGLP